MSYHIWRLWGPFGPVIKELNLKWLDANSIIIEYSRRTRVKSRPSRHTDSLVENGNESLTHSLGITVGRQVIIARQRPVNRFHFFQLLWNKSLSRCFDLSLAIGPP